MIDQNQTDSKTDDAKVAKSVDSRETPPGYISLWGCILSGAISFIKATQVEGIAAAALLLVAVAAFGMAYHICSHQD
jgi:hypothetical protein